jgi:hypothetical protein
MLACRGLSFKLAVEHLLVRFSVEYVESAFDCFVMTSRPPFDVR